MVNPLLDKEFLRQLDLYKHRTTYAKIVLLSFDEQPIEEIQGKITSGSVNVDGASALRRTCSLTMVTDKFNEYDVHWAVKNKFILYVGLENHINTKYPNIIWFKQGVYVISSISYSITTSAYTINISGKDKMCLLNGEMGGSITASTDFGQIDEYEEDKDFDLTRVTTSYPIVDIIKNMVHAYGNELLENIIINDVDNYGLELLEFRTSSEDQYLYYLRQKLTESVTNIKFSGSIKYWYLDNGTPKQIRLDKITEEQLYKPNSLTNEAPDSSLLDIYPSEVIAAGPPREGKSGWRSEIINGETVWYYNDQLTDWKRAEDGYVYNDLPKDYYVYNVMKVENGDTAGYRKTDLTYPGELIGNVNESIVTVLDKIKNTFSDFEYFYDIDGHFVFQKKATYINESWNNIVVSEDQIYAENSSYYSQAGYSFEEGVLLSQINISPNIGDIKNDFSIWGQRALTGDAQLPIHLRYVVDFKPYIYKTLRITKDDIPNKYRDKIDKLTQESVLYYTDEADFDIIANDKSCKKKVLCDWRELIYRMALDYFKYEYMLKDFYILIAANHEKFGRLYSTGKTGYEYYYTDMQGFWRQLYNPDEPEIVTDTGLLTETQFNNLMGSKFVYTKTGTYFNRVLDIDKYDSKTSYYIFDYDYDNYNHNVTKENEYIEYINCWNLDCESHPEKLNFWFDFMDATGFQGKYSVSAIGNRPKAVNDTNITAIYYEDVPTTLFIDGEDWADLQENLQDYDDMVGYTFIQITPSLEKYFTISAQGKSAWDELNNLLYTNTQATETVTLTAIPIYYLEPNKRIFIKDNNIGVNGEYIVSKITVPLAYNGTTSITATKVSDRIY